MYPNKGLHPIECIKTVGDTILMQVKPWFSSEVGKVFLKRENGGGFYYTIFGEEDSESFFDLGRCDSKLVV